MMVVLFVLYMTTLSVSRPIQRRMMGLLMLENDMEGSGIGLTLGTIPALAWRE
jgi:hypothetical protein